MRKFADREQSSNQASTQVNGSNTEATLILCGYSRELANWTKLTRNKSNMLVQTDSAWIRLREITQN